MQGWHLQQTTNSTNKCEEHCEGITYERKYYRIGNTRIKSSLRPHEWQKQRGYTRVPLFNTERILNEGACLQFLLDKTNIPLPKLHACFEDGGMAYVVTECIVMSDLHEEKQSIGLAKLEL